MAAFLDMRIECLCCGKPGYVSSRDWRTFEAPAALCQRCAQTTPDALVRVLYLMRSQIKSLYAEQQLQQRDIKRLFSAQQDMEQALMEERP